tara:strand:- start:210 stop:377 length:168 start_codon:yes stop_codon:yes gene_type:complete
LPLLVQGQQAWSPLVPLSMQERMFVSLIKAVAQEEDLTPENMVLTNSIMERSSLL